MLGIEHLLTIGMVLTIFDIVLFVRTNDFGNAFDIWFCQICTLVCVFISMLVATKT